MEATPTKNKLPLREKNQFLTLTEALDYAAQGQTGYNFYSGGGKLFAVLSYAKLQQEAQALARRFISLDVTRGSRVALVADTHPDFPALALAVHILGEGTKCRLASRLPADDDLILIIAAAEESGCQGSQHLANQTDLLGNAGALIVGEPTSNYPLVGHKGALWLKARFSGRTAHGSMPEKGDNAVYKAVEAVKSLRHFDFGVKHHPSLGAPSLNVGYFHGGVNINSVPDAAEVGIDIRTTPELVNEELIKKISGFLGPDATIIPLVDVSAIWTDPELPWVQAVFNTVAPILGVDPEPKTVAFFTDGAPLQKAYGGIPTLILGPGASAIAHQTDEYCHLTEIDAATAIYERIAEEWYDLPTSN